MTSRDSFFPELCATAPSPLHSLPPTLRFLYARCYKYSIILNKYMGLYGLTTYEDTFDAVTNGTPSCVTHRIMTCCTDTP